MKNTEYWRLRDNQGKAPGLLGWWPSRSVTFIDNHDTGSSQQHWPFPADKVATGYAYIMTHPGMPCVFWEHLFDWGQEVANTIKTLKEVSSIIAWWAEQCDLAVCSEACACETL